MSSCGRGLNGLTCSCCCSLTVYSQRVHNCDETELDRHYALDLRQVIISITSLGTMFSQIEFRKMLAVREACVHVHVSTHLANINRPYLHKLLTINNYLNCPSNFAFARSIYLFHLPIFLKILMRIWSILQIQSNPSELKSRSTKCLRYTIQQ